MTPQNQRNSSMRNSRLHASITKMIGTVVSQNSQTTSSQSPLSSMPADPAGNMNQVSGTPGTEFATTAGMGARDSLLKGLPPHIALDVMKWAESMNIGKDDPAWLLASMLGHSRFYAETLPNRMAAAADQVCRAINSQRVAEQQAFSRQAYALLTESMQQLANRAAKEAGRLIEETTLLRQWQASIWALMGALLLSTISFLCGAFIFGGSPPWSGVMSQHHTVFTKFMALLLATPVGYVLLGLVILAITFLLWEGWIWWRSNR